MNTEHETGPAAACSPAIMWDDKPRFREGLLPLMTRANVSVK